MKIVLAGIIARYPYGGVTWCSLMYLLGLRSLGHDVCYIEDTGECIYNPELNTLSQDPTYGTTYINDTLTPFELGHRWCFINYDETYHGMSRQELLDFCQNADLYINLSGGSWFWRDEYQSIPNRIFIDTDPVFTQLSIAKGDPWYVEFFRGFTRLFTFGSNIGTPLSDVPTGEFTWHKTWQPVVTKLWQSENISAAKSPYTTVMTWRTESFTELDGNKDKEFAHFLKLPNHVDVKFRLAVNGPLDLLRREGWNPQSAMDISKTIHDYHEFVSHSRAEFGIAKHAYVTHRSGWFSDRTECYLAAGRPAIVQDTGWSNHLPTGLGLLPFTTLTEAINAIGEVEADYPRHALHATEISHEYFDADRVLRRLLTKAMA